MNLFLITFLLVFNLEATSSQKIIENSYIKIQISKSPSCNPLENSSDAGFTTLYFVAEKNMNFDTEKLFQILSDASRLSVYDIYEFRPESKLGTGKFLY